jgi:glutathione S-transferase
VSCPRCYSNTTDTQKNSARERQKQWEIAKSRQIDHIGIPQKQQKIKALLPQDAPILYSFRRCPYAMRARLALLVSGIRCEMREITLSHKPANMMEASPNGTVPVLVLKDRGLDQSLDIMYWALEQNDPEGWSTVGQTINQEANAIVQTCDTEFKIHLDRYKYPNRYDLPNGLADREAGSVYLVQLNTKLTQSTFLMGTKWSWVDAAVAPFVRQFARTDRAWFDTQSWTALQNWLTHFEQSERFSTVMHRYKIWHQGAKPLAFPPD